MLHIYIYSLASGENHWNIRKGNTFGRKTCSSDEWITVTLTPFSKKDGENHWTPDLTLDWCRAPYMSCVSNIFFMLFCCFYTVQIAQRGDFFLWVKVDVIETWSSSIQLAVVSEPWWSLLSPKDRVVVVPLPNGRISCLIIKWDDSPSTTSKIQTCRTPSSWMLGVFWAFFGSWNILGFFQAGKIQMDTYLYS